MKNLVKKAKSKNWIAYTFGILSSVLFGIIVYWMTNINYSLLQNKLDITVYLATVSIMSLTSIVVGCVICITIMDKYWDEAKRFHKYVRNYRTQHIALLIEKAIDNDDVDTASKLLDQYANRKNCNDDLLNYLDGVIAGKFNGKANLTLNEVEY